MQELSEDIGRYISGSIDLDQLRENFRSTLRVNPESKWEAAPWLAHCLDAGRISSPVCDALRGVLHEFESDQTVTRAADDRPPSPRDAHAPLAVGSFLGSQDRYELQSVLGEGGMGQVFKARDRLMNNTVALKVLGEKFSQDPDAFRALQHETRRAQELQAPNVVKVFNFDVDGTIAFMLMEYLDGETLEQFQRARDFKPLPLVEAWPILQCIGTALAAAHAQGLVHSDLKPSNVFVCSKGAIKVLDFGIARQVRKSTDATVGSWSPESLGAYTPPYAALEQIRGEPADPRDDIYSFACVAYRLLAGVHPFGEAAADLAMQSKLAPAHIDQLSSRQWNALRHGLAFMREDRIASINKFLEELQPPSLLRKYRLPLAAALIALAAGSLYATAHYYRDYFEGRMLGGGSQEPVKRRHLTREQQQEVEDSMFLAADYLSGVKPADSPEALSYVLSEGANNVNQILDSVLLLDPGNDEAIKMKGEIARLYAQKARSELDSGHAEVAAALIRNGRKAEPRNRELFNLQQDVCEASRSACALVQN